jgi:DNA mismatch repair protein MutL
MSSAPQKIHLLPEHLIDQIKAGEVIERPGSLLKEIIENSVDAGSTRIEITLQNNGLDLISIKDNGQGIYFNDLPLAFSRHATSKISQFEDIYKLNSFGFRGEALASIAAISKVQCITSTLGNNETSEIKIEGGFMTYHGKKQTIPHGTEIIIQHLFYNTPVRMKFIQSQTSEKKFLKKIIYSFVLSHPEIEFLIKFNEEEKEIFSSTENIKTRIEKIIPKAKDQIISIQKNYEENEFEILLIPKQFKLPFPWDYFFINKRMILDKQFHKVISQSIISSLGNEDFYYVSSLHLPSQNIDVNIHPNKTSVKCFETSKILGLISASIKEIGVQAKKNHQIENVTALNSEFGMSPLDKQEIQDFDYNYNLQGFFSPHQIPKESSPQLIWIENSFFIDMSSPIHIVYNSKKLLKEYISENLKIKSPTTPLLVSIPFSNIKKVQLDLLINSGAEIETLGTDTYVLRAIPEWMNGFPLKEVIGTFLRGDDLMSLSISYEEWSTTTWKQFIHFFTITHLIKNKIASNLSELLKKELS